MRFRRLRLVNYRGIDECDIQLLGEGASTGITIVEGPNEAGKSSLAEAIRLLWTYPHSTRHHEVRDIQPVGRDVGTRIELKLDAASVSLTYAKTFNRNPSAELTVRGAHSLHLTGKEAHQRAASLLDDMVDTGLWQALQVPQGVIAQAELAESPALAAALGGSRRDGPGIVDDRDVVIGERINAERARWRTDAGRDRKALTEAAARVERLRADRDEAQEVLDAVAADLSEIERLNVAIPAHREAVRGSSQELATLGEQLATIEVLEARMAELDRRVDTAATLRDHAGSARDERRRLLADYKDARDRLERISEPSGVSADLCQATTAHQEAAQTVSTLDERRRALRSAAGEARSGLEALRDAQELTTLRALQRRLRELAERIAAADQTIADTRINDDVMADLRAAEQALMAARAALSTQGASVRIAALDDTTVQRGEEQARLLPQGSDMTIEVDRDISFSVADLAQIDVTPGEGIASLRAAAELARTRLQQLLDDHQVADIGEAEAVLEAVRHARQDRMTAAAERNGMLEDVTVEELDDRLLALENRPAAQLAGDIDGPLDVDSARQRCGEAERQVSLADDEYQQAVAACREARARRDELRAADERRRVELNIASAAVEQLTQRLERARALKDDDAVEDEWAQRNREVEDARAARAATRRELEACDVTTLRELREALHAAVVSGRERVQADERRLAELRAAVAARSADGPMTRRDALQASLDVAEADLHRRVSRANAAQMVEQVFMRHRAEQRRRYQTPLREEIEQLGRLLWGPTFAVELDDDLRIRTRVLEGRALAFDQLSLGAQEQLALIGRLACAMVVGPDGAPLIVDDALGFSDPERLRRMGAVLSVAGRCCQIILLTCYPQRYLHVTGGRTVQLGPSSDRAGSTAA